ncbi:hypothetical protein IGI04_038855 [Brassica rapa subsp. trilocularis]|uniref:Prepilin-type N-terminal cleavage/methylation domain-containing protein n=1 Tax=Brassica rapa subsp. trilocularis TaxID=1813537 RepID=A0ABQ7LP47_BRACM|nr:hypothetical protein IGI04_038855 [Brassica rapa subsp. trilocularis]
MDERTDGLNHSGRKMTSLLGSGTTLLEIGLVMLMIIAYDSAFRASTRPATSEDYIFYGSSAEFPEFTRTKPLSIIVSISL